MSDDELDGLFVDEEYVKKSLVTAALRPYVEIDPQSLDVYRYPAYRRLETPDQILFLALLSWVFMMRGHQKLARGDVGYFKSGTTTRYKQHVVKALEALRFDGLLRRADGIGYAICDDTATLMRIRDRLVTARYGEEAGE